MERLLCALEIGTTNIHSILLPTKKEQNFFLLHFFHPYNDSHQTLAVNYIKKVISYYLL